MIDIDASAVERTRRYLGAIPGATERAMARALNVAVRRARDEALERIVARYEVKGADVRARLSTQLARPSSLSATLRAKSPSLPLHYFPHTPSSPGTGGPGAPALTATVKRGETREVPGAFVAKLGSKARIAMRTGAKTATGKDALRVLYTIPIAEMLGVDDVRAAVERRAVEVLEDTLPEEITRELEAAQ